MSQPVAIVHDWLTSMRGGERVVEALYNVFPQADLFTLTWNPERLSPALSTRGATTSPIHRVACAPFVGGRFRAMLPFFPLAVESFKLDSYDLVVSSSHCVAIGALAPARALHVAYVHSTLRYAHEAQPTYEASIPGGALGRAIFRGTARYLRDWESRAAWRPDALIANSTYTRDRILRYYGRSAEVIEPPIETGRFQRASATQWPASDAPFLMVSALVPNKRVDLALRAFQGRRERLVLVGEGPERARLEPLAGPNVTMLPRVTDEELAGLLAGCQALLHTGVDDFGMVMVEALAAGRPVLACSQGGALDIVRHGETGMLIDAPTVDSVRTTLDDFAARAGHFDSDVLCAFARRFDRKHFERRFAAAIEQAQCMRRDVPRNGHDGAGARRSFRSFFPPRGEARGRQEQAGASPGANDVEVRRCVERQSPGARAVKRCADVALAAAGLALSAPLLAALGGWIRVDSAGPVLFCQQRVGLERRPFKLVKLRTMSRDGQVTRAGRWLRPLGLDELPQLWNVLRGEMSLVGPRPEVPDRVERLQEAIAGYNARHLMRPGITGWAQVNGLRGDKSSMVERQRLDVEYVRDWSLARDGRVLLRTIPAVVADTLREMGS